MEGINSIQGGRQLHIGSEKEAVGSPEQPTGTNFEHIRSLITACYVKTLNLQAQKLDMHAQTLNLQGQNLWVSGSKFDGDKDKICGCMDKSAGCRGVRDWVNGYLK